MFLVMEYLCFNNVKFIAESMNGFPIQAIRFIAAQFVMVIEYLHELKIAFLDLHEQNYCFDYRGYLKLIDFGHARPFEYKIPQNYNFLSNLN